MSKGHYHFPQVLLLGNGLNRAAKSDDWKKLIQEIALSKKVIFDGNDGALKDLPYPLLAVLATDDQVDRAICTKPIAFSGIGEDELDQVAQLYRELLLAGFDEILTTNYSYEIERVADSRITQLGKECAHLMCHTNGVSRAESRYLLHTYNKVVCNGVQNRVWHIHGEIRKPSSVVLGHYFYANLLSKWQQFFQRRGNSYEQQYKEGLPPLNDSWLDAFILGDVYVLGFGYDFSEFDLWWLLNRKKREKAPHGKLHFYAPPCGNEAKFMMLETYDAQIESLGFRLPHTDYKSFYEEAIRHIVSHIRTIMEE